MGRVQQIKTSKELGLPEPQPGYAWPTTYTLTGRYVAVRQDNTWELVFEPDSGDLELLQTYPPTEAGERQAKQAAIAAYLQSVGLASA